jgi:hypothetical protein
LEVLSREPKDEAVVVALVEVAVRGDDLYGGWVVVQQLPIWEGVLTGRVDGSNSGNIPTTQPRPLPDCLPPKRFDRRLAISAERGARIMHDRVEVVSPYVISVGDMLIEVMFSPRNDIFESYPYVLIPIFSALLVPQTHSMSDLMDCSAHAAAGPQRDNLPSASHPHLRKTAILHFENEEVGKVTGISGLSLYKTNRGSLFPMSHRQPNEFPVRVINFEGDQATRPAEPLTRDYNTMGRQIT